MVPAVVVDVRKVLTRAAVVLLAAGSAFAQSDLVDKIQSGLDDVAKGMNYVGQKAGDLVGPGLGLGEEKKTPFNESNTFNQTYPVGPTPVISISNQFGEIRVNTWDDRVVQVNAEIHVGAESAEVAAEVVKAISIRVTHTEELAEIKTLFPETKQEWGYVAMTVNYTISVPKTASLITDNFFGDTIVRGAGGMLAIEAQYGMVDIADAAGNVKVRTHGEFPVKAHGLASGGVFQLHNAQAEFSAISGELEVNNFRGSVTLSDLAPDAYVDVTSDGGPIHLLLAPDLQPDLTATVLYGTFASDLPVSQTAQGGKIIARCPSVDSKQRVLLSSSFGDVRIERRVKAGETKPGTAEGAKPFNDELSRAEAAPEGTSIHIDAAPGDVRVEGIDVNEVRVKATRTVWVPQASKASGALEALQLQVQRAAGRLDVNTVAVGDMKALECSSYRVDLVVQCPRSLPVEIHVQEGQTTLSELGGAVTLNQNAGELSADHNLGPLNLTNENGSITVTDCSGPVEVSGHYGPVTLSRNLAKVSAQCVQGRIVIESAKSDVTAKCNGGDIRILALDGVGGAYDILSENGNLSMALAPEADAALNLKTTGGTVHSAIPLNGSTAKDQQEFSGRLKNGAYPVRLEARGGDIYLD